MSKIPGGHRAGPALVVLAVVVVLLVVPALTQRRDVVAPAATVEHCGYVTGASTRAQSGPTGVVAGLQAGAGRGTCDEEPGATGEPAAGDGPDGTGPDADVDRDVDPDPDPDPDMTGASGRDLDDPAAEPQPEPATDAVWDRLAQCESTGNWTIDTGNGYFGGLQFDAATWKDYGGTEFAPLAHQATKEQQVLVATRLRDDRGGYGAWPACSAKLGLPR